MENGAFAQLLYFHNIFKYMIFQRRQKALSWSKVIIYMCESIQAGLEIRVHNKLNFLILSIKIYVVGTQKNRLNESVLLSTQNKC